MRNGNHSPLFTKDDIKHETGKDQSCSQPLQQSDRMLEQNDWRQNGEELSRRCDYAARQRSERTDCHKDEVLAWTQAAHNTVMISPNTDA